MTSKFKDFGSLSTDKEAKPPISFKLYDEEFHCVPEIQGKVLLDLVADASSQDPIKNAALIDDFFGHVLTDESLDRFNALLTSKEKIVSVNALGEITAWLVEQYSSRPEEQPEV